MRNQLDGGEVLLAAFRDLGVDYIVSCAGSEWPPLWEALARQKRDKTDGPTYIDCNHEVLAVSMAAAYTQITGRIQIVLLHAGAGLAQGSIAIAASRALETPMLIMSGESAAYGETDFDPGSQWYRNLGVVGGAQRIIEPMVKWAQSIPCYETLYHSVLRAGEMAQRIPKGPTYLCVSMETMLQHGREPVARRVAPPAPKQRPIENDINRVAALIAAANRPIISVQTSGPDRATFDALVRLADTFAIPVFEGAGAFFGNFPKSHEMHLGADLEPFLQECDLVLLVENATPWYPPSKVPHDISIVAIGESPLKPHLVYQNLGAHHFLEGDVAETLCLLAAAVEQLGLDKVVVAERRSYWKQQHERLCAGRNEIERQAQEKDVVTVPLLVKSFRDVLPKHTCYVDETIVHMRSLNEHLIWEDPHTYFRTPSGLGQGLGYALGVKMALPDRTVVMTIGDGTFMFNPVVAALAFADEHNLPLIIVVLNNLKYGVMEELHNRFYPDGISRQERDYYGVNLRDLSYEQLAAVVGGYGCRVERPEDLEPAIAMAFDSVKRGKCAILNVIMPETVAFK